MNLLKDSMYHGSLLVSQRFVQSVSQSVRPTYLALYNDDSSFVVNTHTARMLQDIGAKLSNKLAVLVVDLNLMRWRPARYKY